MNDTQKQELIELFKHTPYMPFHEALGLLMACQPDRSRLIKRMLLDDIRHFKLNVYFWTTFSYDGETSLSAPVSVTAETLGYHVPPPSENYGNFWLFGELSTSELKSWLHEKGISVSFLETSKVDVTISEALPGHRKPQLEIKQGEAAALAGVTTRTIRNWDNGIRAPQGYPGRQSRAIFMAFVEGRESDKRFKKAARATQRALPSGDMDKFSEEENF
ncbi:MAG: hypothetical protein LIP28_04280 [Deltaproteobacteria bacterium]|nr:hypothetical protein [Deltaproteobacteria bacterium]